MKTLSNEYLVVIAILAMVNKLTISAQKSISVLLKVSFKRNAIIKLVGNTVPASLSMNYLEVSLKKTCPSINSATKKAKNIYSNL